LKSETKLKNVYYSFKSFCIKFVYVMLVKYTYIFSWVASYCT